MPTIPLEKSFLLGISNCLKAVSRGVLFIHDSHTATGAKQRVVCFSYHRPAELNFFGTCGFQLGYVVVVSGRFLFVLINGIPGLPKLSSTFSSVARRAPRALAIS